MKHLWLNYIVWPIYRLSPGYRWLHRYLTKKGYVYVASRRIWQNDRFEVAPCGHWRCGGFHVYDLKENRWAGWTELDAAAELEDGIGF